MINAEILLDETGPLPLKTAFFAPADGSVMFALTGTAYTNSGPSITGVELWLDGVQIGAAAMGYANQNANHQALRPSFIMLDNLTPGEHSIAVTTSVSETVTDVNDYFQVVLFY